MVLGGRSRAGKLHQLLSSASLSLSGRLPTQQKTQISLEMFRIKSLENSDKNKDSRDAGTLHHIIIIAFVCLLCELRALCELPNAFVIASNNSHCNVYI